MIAALVGQMSVQLSCLMTLIACFWLRLISGAGSNTVGSLPTARPQKHKKPDKMKHKEKVQTPVNSYRPETESKNSLGVDGSGTSMPNLFTDVTFSTTTKTVRHHLVPQMYSRKQNCLRVKTHFLCMNWTLLFYIHRYGIFRAVWILM